jgi:hypothetical protein
MRVSTRSARKGRWDGAKQLTVAQTSLAVVVPVQSSRVGDLRVAKSLYEAEIDHISDKHSKT